VTISQQNSELDRRSAHIIEQQHDFREVKAAQQKELESLQRVNSKQSQTIEGLQWLNLEQNQELERRSAQIDALAAELKGIYGTPAGRALRTYRSLRDRWKKAA
jgi:septal ring factor EnvC (AmiA/AmiB activator)